MISDSFLFFCLFDVLFHKIKSDLSLLELEFKYFQIYIKNTTSE